MSVATATGGQGGAGGSVIGTANGIYPSYPQQYYYAPPSHPNVASIVAALDSLMNEPGASDLSVADDMNVAEILLLVSVHPDIASAYRGVLNRRGA